MESVDSALAIVAESDPVAANTRVAILVGQVGQLSGRAGERLADSVAVRVTDSTGRALADIPVRWTVDDGGVAPGVGAVPAALSQSPRRDGGDRHTACSSRC